MNFRRTLKKEEMRSKRGFSIWQLVFLIGLFLLPTPGISQTVNNDPEVKQEVLDQVSRVLSEQAFVPGVDFSKWPRFLAEQRTLIDAAKDDDEFRTAVNTALSKLGTSHVVLLTPRSSNSRRTGSTVGVGISLQVVPEGLAVVRVVKDSSADKAGIGLGDTIVEVEGKPVKTAPNLTGEEGSELSLKIKHGDGKLQEYKLTRQKYSTVRVPELVWINQETAQLKVYSFDIGYYDRLKVVDLMREASKAKNLVIDLRFNGGGAVSNLQHLLGMLIPDGKPVGTFVRRSMVAEYFESTGNSDLDLAAIGEWSERKFRPVRRADLPLFAGKIVVLINKFSGSASEIAAAALHDVMGATVIGTKSAGAVLASVVDPVSNGFMLQYPIEDYVTIKGIRLEGNGVSPDVIAQDLNLRVANGHDDGVDKACIFFAQAKSVQVDTHSVHGVNR